MTNREIKFKSILKNPDNSIEIVIWEPFNDSDDADKHLGEGQKILAYGLQFTGLKDKNGEGQELFEGDLITNASRNGGKPHPIEWSDEFGGWIGNYELKYLIAPELREITKRGNIYNNPELL